MPSVLPCSSTPSHFDRRQLPAFRSASACGTLRAWEMIRAIGVLGGREDVRLRGVDHHHALAGGGGHVDVVEADAGPADHDEIGAGLEDLGV